MDDAGLESSHRLKRVNVVPSADDARIVGNVGSSRAAAQSLEESSGRTCADLELGLFL